MSIGQLNLRHEDFFPAQNPRLIETYNKLVFLGNNQEEIDMDLKDLNVQQLKNVHAYVKWVFQNVKKSKQPSCCSWLWIKFHNLIAPCFGWKKIEMYDYAQKQKVADVGTRIFSLIQEKEKETRSVTITEAQPLVYSEQPRVDQVAAFTLPPPKTYAIKDIQTEDESIVLNDGSTWDSAIIIPEDWKVGDVIEMKDHPTSPAKCKFKNITRNSTCSFKKRNPERMDPTTSVTPKPPSLNMHTIKKLSPSEGIVVLENNQRWKCYDIPGNWRVGDQIHIESGNNQYKFVNHTCHNYCFFWKTGLASVSGTTPVAQSGPIKISSGPIQSLDIHTGVIFCLNQNFKVPPEIKNMFYDATVLPPFHHLHTQRHSRIEKGDYVSLFKQPDDRYILRHEKTGRFFDVTDQVRLKK